MIHLVSYRILAGWCIQILADTREMVTDTLWVMSVAHLSKRDAQNTKGTRLVENMVKKNRSRFPIAVLLTTLICSH